MFGYSMGSGYELANEHQLSEILANFSSDYIYDIISDQINKRYEFAIVPKPNIVNTFKSNFDNIRANFPMDVENTNAVEGDTYRNVIDIICNNCNVSFDTITDDNIYLIAAALYDFLVCSFNKHMVDFIINLIIKEQDSIYSALELEESKKNKDSSTIYNRKTMENTKLAVINANLPQVLQYIATLDIDMLTLLQSCYHQPMVDLLVNNIGENVNIYNTFMKEILSNEYFLPEYITEIRLRIQSVG